MDIDEVVAGVREPPRVPAGLRPRGGGRRLWRGVLSEYLLRSDEDGVLRLAVHTLDEIEAMRAELAGALTLTVTGARGQVAPHPLIEAVERHQRALLNLLAYLRASLDSADSHGDAASRAGAALVNKRWARRRGG